MNTTQTQQDSDIRQKLEEVREWAGKQINREQIAPWSRFYCAKLNEALCQILYGWECPIELKGEDSPKLVVQTDASRPPSG